jgi:hypothetical protein
VATRYQNRRVLGSTVGAPDSLLLFSGNTVNAARPGWETVDKSTGAIAGLPAVVNPVAQLTNGSTWQPLGNYVATAFGATAPRCAIFKRLDLTSLTRLTTGVPSWSTNKTFCAWDGNDRLICVGETATQCEVAARVGDTFTFISTPVDIQHNTNNFGVAAQSDFMILGGFRDASNFTHRTYAWDGSKYVFGSGYDFGVSTSARRFAISPDGNTVAVMGQLAASAAILRIYSRSGTTLTQVQANLLSGTTGVTSCGLAFTPDGKYLYFTQNAGTTALLQGWVTATWATISLGVTLVGGNGVSVSPLSTLLAVADDTADRHKIYSINTSTGALTLLTTSTFINQSFSDVAFNRNDTIGTA